MDSNEEEKNESKVNQILSKEINSIFLYYKWDESKNRFRNEKKSTENTEILYVLNQEFIKEWKEIIKYDALKEEIRSEKEKDRNKEETNIINEFYKKNEFDKNNLGEINNLFLIKDSVQEEKEGEKAEEEEKDEKQKDEKQNGEEEKEQKQKEEKDEKQKEEKPKKFKNPKLIKEEIELVNKEVFDYFKYFKMNAEIEVECIMKDGEYILYCPNKIEKEENKEEVNEKCIEQKKKKEDDSYKKKEVVDNNSKEKKDIKQNEINNVKNEMCIIKIEKIEEKEKKEVLKKDLENKNGEKKEENNGPQDNNLKGNENKKKNEIKIDDKQKVKEEEKEKINEEVQEKKEENIENENNQKEEDKNEKEEKDKVKGEKNEKENLKEIDNNNSDKEEEGKKNDNNKNSKVLKDPQKVNTDKIFLEKKRNSSEKDENTINNDEDINVNSNQNEKDKSNNELVHNNFENIEEKVKNIIIEEEKENTKKELINKQEIPNENIINENSKDNRQNNTDNSAQNIINENPISINNNDNDNTNHNLINENKTDNNNDTIQKNNINNFEAFKMNFQLMVQNYLKENGYENNFINLYLNISKFEPKNEEEKQMIKYLQTKMDNYQPNIINGLVILNTQIPSLGLQNVGATCYMNSTLQCLIHIKELSEILLSAFYLKYPLGNSNLCEKHKLTLEYVNILKQVFFPKFYGNQSPCFAPYKFKELVGELNPLFCGINANDAKDLLQFILERMHSEVKMAMQFFMDYNIDQTDEMQTKQYFYNSYVYQNNSPFLSYLFGIIKIKTECLNCHTIKYNFQTYNLLYFPLKKSKKKKKKKKKEENKDFEEKNYILSLEDCFMYNEKVERFTGDNSMYCNVCNGLYDANYQSMLYYTPTVLAIVLNRGRGNLDFQEKFNFGNVLNIEKYLNNDEKKGKYYLISMVVHFGESSMSGHFMAYCRMDKDSKWFCYNDAFVNECKNFDEIKERGTPYILFYHQE